MICNLNLKRIAQTPLLFVVCDRLNKVMNSRRDLLRSKRTTTNCKVVRHMFHMGESQPPHG